MSPTPWSWLCRHRAWTKSTWHIGLVCYLPTARATSRWSCRHGSTTRHAAYPRRALSSDDTGEDRALASDAQEPHPAGELLFARRARGSDAARHECAALPQRIFSAHPPDQRAQFRSDLRSASERTGFPTPVPTEAAAVPAHEGLGPDDSDGLEDRWKPSIQLDQEQAIAVRELDTTTHLPLRHDQLISERRALPQVGPST